MEEVERDESEDSQTGSCNGGEEEKDLAEEEDHTDDEDESVHVKMSNSPPTTETIAYRRSPAASRNTCNRRIENLNKLSSLADDLKNNGGGGGDAYELLNPHKPRLPTAGTPAVVKAKDNPSRFIFDPDTLEKELDDSDESAPEEDSEAVAESPKETTAPALESGSRAHAQLLPKGSTADAASSPKVTSENAAAAAAAKSKSEIDELFSKVSDSRRASDCAKTIRSFNNEAGGDSPNIQPSPPEAPDELLPTGQKLRRFNIKKHSVRGNAARNSPRSSVSAQPPTTTTTTLHGWESLSRALARVGVHDYLPDEVVRDGSWHQDTTSILKPTPSPEVLRSTVHPTADVMTTEPEEPGSASGSSKKSVSFGGLPTELSVKNSSDCVQIMRDGHHLNKMRSSSRIYKRFYWFDEQSNCIRWQPSKKESSKAMIELSTIREVRSGKNTELFLTSDISSMFLDDFSFSIIHGSEGEEESLDLIAGSPDEANVWITGIRYLLTPGLCLTRLDGGSDPCCDPRDVWLASMFDRADSNKDGLLDADESLRLITNISDGIRELRVKQKLSEYLQLKGAGDKSRLSRIEFIELFKDVTTRPEIYFLLARYSSISSDQLSPTDLQLFLQSEQGLSDVTLDQCLELIEKYEPCQSARDVPALSIDGFTKYLMSVEGSLIDPKHHKVCQDMTQPLHNYFIAASHNTYLMEDQVDGPCSANAYVRALLRCCRCVELDCWDGVKGEPIVTHGHTQTNTIMFKKVIEAINASAFRNSQYPVVIYIENHCTQEQQLKMAAYIRNIFGSKIYTIPDGVTELPSPDQLKCKLIISAKKLPPEAEGLDADYVQDDDEGAAVKQVISMNAASQAAAGNNLVRVSGGTSPDTSPTKEMMSGGMWEPLFNTRRRHLLAREMSDLISCVDRHMHEDQSLDELAANNNEQNHLFSMHEKAVFNLIDRSPKQLCDFTKSHLTRVFPSEGRIDSTNFNAQDIWNSGAQIASLNYQTPGLIMDINDGRFSMNGGCGYVLKPKFMRDKLSYFSPFGEQPASLSRCLHLRIISGQNFPKPRGGGAKGNVIDPYVLIELFGVSVDCREDRTRTATNDNGVCPQFDESFEFRLAVPSLVLVRFVVLDDDFIGDEFIGQYTAPLECMRPGYRHLNLRSIYDEPLDRATLFVHIAYTDIDCPLLGSHLTTPMITSTGASSPTTMGRTTSFRRNGTATSSTVQRWSSRKKNNRNSQNGSLAREPDPISLRPVGLVAFDDAFGRLSSSLGKVAAIRDVVRMSLAFFRESCGLAAPTSIKRCIRSLYERSRPRHCPTSPSPTSCGDAAVQPSRDHVTSLPPLTIWREGNKRPHLQLIMRGSCAIGENWKKTQVAFDNLVNELTMAVEMAEPLDGVFAITLAKIAKLHEDFGQIYDSEYNRSPGHHSAASSSGGNVSAQSLPTAGGVEVAVTKNSSYGSERKKSGKKRRTVKDLMLDSERRVAIEETIKWNCSMIDATRQLCAHLTETSTKILRDLWQGAVMCGIGKQSDKSSQSTTTTPPHHHSSSNGSADGSTSS